MKHIAIAIDGPAGSGKSTAAREVARRLGITYLDTGAMYRSVALKALKNGIDPRDHEAVTALLPDTDIRICIEDDTQRFFLDGEDITGQIRTPEVSQGASDVGMNPAVRRFLVAMQQEIARGQDVVMDGRDIGTHVLPDAPFKFFMTADSRVRAERRHKELAEKGSDKTVEAVHEEMLLRDANDSNRDYAPLRQAEDAVLLDTTGLTADAVVEYILSIVQAGKK
ncbi:MAG: (d)CMP kinase [Bacillota bacterium]